MGHLMGRIGVVCNVLVLHLGKEIWELLIQGTTGVEVMIGPSLVSSDGQGFGDIRGSECVFSNFLDLSDGSKVSQKASQQCWCSPSFLMKLINGKGIVGSSKQIEELRVDTNAGGRGM